MSKPCMPPDGLDAAPNPPGAGRSPCARPSGASSRRLSGKGGTATPAAAHGGIAGRATQVTDGGAPAPGPGTALSSPNDTSPTMRAQAMTIRYESGLAGLLRHPRANPHPGDPTELARSPGKVPGAAG